MKLKKILALAAIAVFGGVNSVSAAWTGTTPSTGDYYILNVGAQMFLNHGSSWGTHVTVDGAGCVITIGGTDGAYTLHHAGIASNKYQTEDGWSDNVTPGKFAFEDAGGGAYYIKCSNGNYYKWAGGSGKYGDEATVAEKEDNEVFKWIFVPKADREAFVAGNDVTYKIGNPDFHGNINGQNGNVNLTPWTSGFGTHESAQLNFTGAFAEKWVAGPGTLQDLSHKQTISGLPAGKYTLSVAGNSVQQSDGSVGTGTFVYAGDANTEFSGQNIFSVDFKSTGADVEIGVKTVSTTANWVSFDKFRLTFLEPAVSTVATATIGTTTATADSWYSLGIAKAGEYRITSNVDATLTYTQDGNLLLSEATTTQNLTAGTPVVMDLAVGTIYFKSSVAGEVKILPNTLENAQDITDLFVVNPGFESDLNGWTNSNSMMQAQGNKAFDGYQGSKYAEVYGTNRTFGISQTMASMPAGFYVVSANAYQQGNYSTAPTLQAGSEKVNVLNFSSKYSVATKLESTGNLIIGYGGVGANGGNWACVDVFNVVYYKELPAVTVTDGKMNASVASALSTAKQAYDADKTAANFNALQNADMTAKVSAKAYTALKTQIDAYAARVNALDAAGQSAFNTATSTLYAGYEAGTLSDNEANAGVDAIAAAYIAAVKAQNTIGADMTAVMPTTWTNQTGNYSGCSERYVEAGFAAGNVLYQTVEGLHAGYYNVQFYGVANHARNLDDSYHGNGIAQIYANDVTEDIEVHKQEACTPTNYLRTINVYLAEDGNLEYGLKNIKTGGQWYVAKAVSLTYLGANEQEATLAGVISKADCSDNTPWTGSGRTTETMVAYDGKNRTIFSSNTKTAPGYKVGQRKQEVTLPYTGTYKLTAFVKIPAATGYVNISVDDLVQKTVYGTDVKSMKTVDTNGAKTETINSDAQGWVASEMYFDANEGDNKTIYLNISDGASQDAKYVNHAYLSGLKLEYAENGLEIALGETGVNPAVANNTTASDVTVAKAMKTGKYNTLCLPFSMDIPTGWTVLELSEISGSQVNFTTAASIEAGKGYLVQVESDETSVQATDVQVNLNASAESAADGYEMVGTLASVAAPVGSYVLQTLNGEQKFYIVADGKQPTLNPFKAYLQPAASEGKASFSIGFGDDNATAVSAVNALIEGKAEIYTVGGVKLEKLQKGINIVNGVPVMVK